MRILVACEYSGVVRDAFIARGHDAMSCDLLPTESPGPHYQGDVMYIINDGWDMMIAFPPCTYLTNASAVRMRVKGIIQKERYQKMLEARKFFIDLYNFPIEHIAIENPTPMKICELPMYSQAIQPYHFGHPYSKRTCLWLKNLPPLISTCIIENHEPYVNGGCKDAYGNYRKFQGRKERDQKSRSKTFTGIAAAMAEQWGEIMEGAKMKQKCAFCGGTLEYHDDSDDAEAPALIEWLECPVCKRKYDYFTLQLRV
jgi:hypothetical protein